MVTSFLILVDRYNIGSDAWFSDAYIYGYMQKEVTRAPEIFISVTPLSPLLSNAPTLEQCILIKNTVELYH
ncbi:MAG TPA: hypothetical protein DCS54_01855 [Oribacterium sp.]|jgi:1,2-phenylacetyl-CoA epoxidase catalytic subunit|nr:hypothetical protein [Oribacterium sp.]